MNNLYIECNMGVAGDMLMGALLDLCENKQDFIDRLNSIGLKDTQISANESKKCGISGCHVSVKVAGVEEESHDVHMHEHEHEHEHEHNHEHEHTHEHEHHHAHMHYSMHDVEDIIYGLNIKDKIKKQAVEIYKLIAEAESKAHNMDVTEIHFHEVGRMDAIADVVGNCMLIDELNIDKITVSPVVTGYGNVRCAHGILPVPAPATEYLLEDIPSYAGDCEGELTTPTGAALIRYFANEFKQRPVMKVKKTGYGMGTKDFERANCVRTMLYESFEDLSNDDGFKLNDEIESDRVVEMSCNLDDMTPEEIGFAMDVLFDKGALDVYISNIIMKKNRPGMMLNLICKEADADYFADLIFKHTRTIGIRRYICDRYKLKREVEDTQTSLGKVRIKHSFAGEISRDKYEYDDIAKIARENDLSLYDVREVIENEG